MDSEAMRAKKFLIKTISSLKKEEGERRKMLER